MAVPAHESTDFGPDWTADDNRIHFRPHHPSRIPRAWERAPKSAFAPRLKGHKVWKRYDLRPKPPDVAKPSPSEAAIAVNAQEDSVRAVKRLCLGEEEVGTGRQRRDGLSYIGTLWGKGPEYDKRKLSKRRSLKRDDRAKILVEGEVPNGSSEALQEMHDEVVDGEARSQSACLDGSDEKCAKVPSLQPLVVRLNDESVESYALAGTSSNDYDRIEKTDVPHRETGKLIQVDFDIVAELESRQRPGREQTGTDYNVPSKSTEAEAVQTCPTAALPEDAAEEPCAADRRTTGEKGIKTKDTPSKAYSSHSALILLPNQADANESEPTNRLALSKNEVNGSSASPTIASILSEVPEISVSSVQSFIPTTERQGEVRSSSRLSDDTTMLKDFLDRAKARKAAKNAQSSEDVRQPMSSPRRSPRRVLAAVDSNSTSPKKSQDIANRPGTPPGKQKLGTSGFDDADECAVEQTSIRRSARVRVPAPQKLPLGTPSFIPVRRPDGTEPVVLQKSIAQELAIITRANTRRNKGQSKPADLTLQELPREPAELDTFTKEVREAAKQVAWDDTLVYYLEGEDATEEKKPKVRRLKGLGTANGTPAPTKKVTSTIASHAGTPGPKRKGRTRI
ncbi:MAG: hypothetical protein M1830_010841 [Pleopsidium flavum]|nr:MAG: hypothetical protein M1830_010841 [Pleopsidium flavum]